jgi:hypothetical protein
MASTTSPCTTRSTKGFEIEFRALLSDGAQEEEVCFERVAEPFLEGSFLSFRSVSTKESYTDRSSVYATTPKTFNPHLYQTRSKVELARAYQVPPSGSKRGVVG